MHFSSLLYLFLVALVAAQSPTPPIGVNVTIEPGIVHNFLGIAVNRSVYMYQNQFSFFGLDLPIFGNDSDIENIQARIDARQSSVKSDAYFTYTFIDSVSNIAFNAILLPIRQPRAINPLAVLNYVFFTVILTTILVYWLRTFHLSVLSLSIYMLVVSWRFSSSEISADLKSAAFVSLLCSLLSLMHFSYGQIQGTRFYNPLILLIIQYLFTVSFDTLFFCDRAYYEDNLLWLTLVIAIFLMLFTIITTSDQDSSRGAAFFFLVSMAAQAYYYFVLIIRSKVYSPVDVSKYYFIIESILLSHGSFIVKIQDINLVLSSALIKFAENFNGGIDKNFDVAGSMMILILISFLAMIYATLTFFVYYFLYSFRISANEANKRMSLPIQYVFGICRYIIDVSTNLIGLSGNSLALEMMRFNSGTSTIPGAMYLASSICFNAFAVFNPRYVVSTAIILSLFAYVIMVTLTNEAVRELVTVRSPDPSNMSLDQKLTLIATGRQYIPHAFSPYVGLNTAALSASGARAMSFISDVGTKSNIVPIAANRFLICLHQLFSKVDENNVSSFNAKDILGKIVTIGTSKVKIVKLQVPYQKANIPDRIICLQTDNDFTANFLKAEHIQAFTPGLDCVVYSKNRVDPREGRVLGCSSKDVFMHTIPLEPGDSGGLVNTLNGRSVGCHSGSLEPQKVSYAFRLDTIFPQILDESQRVVDAKMHGTILSLSETRDLR